MKKVVLFSGVMGVTSAMLLVAAWRGNAQSGPPKQTSTVLGQLLPGLTDDQKTAFAAGLKSFSTTETREDGLGPVFNGTSCAECHKAGAIGGANIDVTTGRVTRIGGMVNGVYSDLEQFGGPVLQGVVDEVAHGNGESVHVHVRSELGVVFAGVMQPCRVGEFRPAVLNHQI